MTTFAPYGSWTSPITADLLVEAVVHLMYPKADGDRVVWVEMRPQEGGRYTLVTRDHGGETRDLLPPELAVRTLVHEYGGLAYAVANGTIWFSNFSDQRLYRLPEGGRPKPTTPEPDHPDAHR